MNDARTAGLGGEAFEPNSPRPTMTDPPLPPDPLIELHWSEISTWQTCGVLGHKVWDLGLRRAPNAFLHAGTGAHAGIERNMRHKVEHQMSMAPRDEVSDVARDATIHRIEAEGILLTADDATVGFSKIKARTVDIATRMSLLHYDKIAPGIEPIEVEKEWRVEVNGANLALAGRIDCIAADGIHDAKTASRMPHANEAEKSDQLSAYALAHLVIYGALPAKLFLDKMVFTEAARNDPKAQGIPKILETVRTKADLIPFLRRVEAVVRMKRSGAYIPCARDSWKCSEKWCGFYPDCEYVK